ncbi:MAG: J domain-containing protein [Planctomycetota bacterium]|nr:J domain-containing protein [Planctomycetota bacterium]
MAKKTPEKERSARLIEELAAKNPAELDQLLLEGPLNQLKELVADCYCADLVNLLLDAKRSSVRSFFLRAITSFKRLLTPVVTLYNYRIYLLNPLPLSLKGSDGEIHPNYYALLGVPPNATDEEVSSAYKLLAKAHAPESFSRQSRTIGEERLKELAVAHKLLKTADGRQEVHELLCNQPEHCFPQRQTSWTESANFILT